MFARGLGTGFGGRPDGFDPEAVGTAGLGRQAHPENRGQFRPKRGPGGIVAGIGFYGQFSFAKRGDRKVQAGDKAGRVKVAIFWSRRAERRMFSPPYAFWPRRATRRA